MDLLHYGTPHKSQCHWHELVQPSSLTSLYIWRLPEQGLSHLRFSMEIAVVRRLTSDKLATASEPAPLYTPLAGHWFTAHSSLDTVLTQLLFGVA